MENTITWIVGAAAALVTAAAVMIRAIAKNPTKAENGQKEFRMAIREDIHRLEAMTESLHAKVDAIGNRMTVVETKLALKDK